MQDGLLHAATGGGAEFKDGAAVASGVATCRRSREKVVGLVEGYGAGWVAAVRTFFETVNHGFPVGMLWLQPKYCANTAGTSKVGGPIQVSIWTDRQSPVGKPGVRLALEGIECGQIPLVPGLWIQFEHRTRLIGAANLSYTVDVSRRVQEQQPERSHRAV